MGRRLALPKNERGQVDAAIRTAFTELGAKATIDHVISWLNLHRRPQLHWLLEATAADDDRIRKYLSARRPGRREAQDIRAAVNGIGTFGPRLLVDIASGDSHRAKLDAVGFGLSSLVLVSNAAKSIPKDAFEVTELGDGRISVRFKHPASARQASSVPPDRDQDSPQTPNPYGGDPAPRQSGPPVRSPRATTSRRSSR